MSRTARASLGGYAYHVINRGNGRSEVFHKDADYAAFLKLLAQASERLPRGGQKSGQKRGHSTFSGNPFGLE